MEKLQASVIERSYAVRGHIASSLSRVRSFLWLLLAFFFLPSLTQNAFLVPQSLAEARKASWDPMPSVSVAALTRIYGSPYNHPVVAVRRVFSFWQESLTFNLRQRYLKEGGVALRTAVEELRAAFIELACVMEERDVMLRDFQMSSEQLETLIDVAVAHIVSVYALPSRLSSLTPVVQCRRSRPPANIARRCVVHDAPEPAAHSDYANTPRLGAERVCLFALLT